MWLLLSNRGLSRFSKSGADFIIFGRGAKIFSSGAESSFKSAKNNSSHLNKISGPGA